VESAELIAILHEVRDRVRARNPQTAVSGVSSDPGAPAPSIPLPDLMPLVHARDSALGKVAAIGTVNPRPGGPINWVVQTWKQLVARVLDWHVREQVDFNRKTMACIDAALEALNDTNRALSELSGGVNRSFGEIAGRIASIEKLGGEFAELSREFNDIRSHWADWRLDWERKLETNEIQFLRSVADLQAGFQHRVDLMDANHREAMHAQHADYLGALDRSGVDIQKRLWADLERIRLEYEGLIHRELRVIRQRAAVNAAAPAPQPIGPETLAGGPPAFDYGSFAERFRGGEDYVKAGQQFYLPYFQGCRSVLDIGCGRGEFLEMMHAAGIPARGIDLSDESIALCRHKGLEADKADLFAWLTDQPESSLDGIFCAQVVEHLPPERLPEMIRLAAGRLQRGGVMAIETPNPECLAIFATHFYLDPTHTRPVPHALLAFYLEEFGMGSLEVRRLSPAIESMPSLASLPEDFREAFFGGLDYAIVAKKV
jgi:O-antigen chain-terminating methyltransferase